METLYGPKTDESRCLPAFRATVAMAALASHENLQDLAKRYGVSVELVTQWKHQLLSDAVRAFDQPTAHAVGGSEISKNELALAIAENSTQGFAMMDERGYCIYVNHAWLQMTGYTAEELSSTVLHDLVHHHYPDGRPYPMAECPIDRALPENFAVCAHEDLFFRKDGTAFSVMCSASPIFKDDRRVATVIEIRDITERKRVDEELRRTTERQAFQLQLAECLRELSNPEEITEAASLLLGMYLKAGRVGYAETDLAGKKVLVHRDWTSGAMSSLAGKARPLECCGLAIINELKNGKGVRLDDIVEDERSAPYRDGYACIEVRSMIAVPLMEEHRLAAILYLHESAPRDWLEEEVRLAEDAARWTWESVKHARAEQTLRDETRMLELLNQTGQIVSSTLDMQTLLHSITDTATQLSGAKFGAFFYTAKNEQGDAFTLYTLSGAQREAFDQLGHPCATPLFAPTFKGAPAIRSDDVTQDARYGKCGPHHGMPPKHLPVRSYLAVSVTARSGEVLGAMLFGHPDVGIFTERTEKIIAGVASQAAVAIDNVRLYEQAQKAAQEREDLLTRERAARAEAERLSRMKDEFLAMLAHELRNPLAPISAAAELLNIMYANDPHVQETSEIISRQVSHMTRLVDDLLDVSRVTRGFVTLNKTIIDFRHVVAGALDQVRPLIEQKRHHVATRLPSEPVYVHGDETRLVQTVSNILNNAAKYTPEDGNIEIKLKIAAEQFQLHIKDNGSGIAPELLSDVFGLFTQGARTLARSQGGLGLGLALAKKLVELHGGQVSAYSAGLGKGSEFIITLPLASSVPQAPAHVHPALKLHASKSGQLHPQALRLTVVDDNIDAADMLASLLRAQGHTVSVYYRAQDALNSATRDVPHAFLLDIGLPDMDGYELARRLRAQPETARSTLIAVTGYGQAQDREQSRAAGFEFHLVKPVDVHALTMLLKDIAAVRVMQS